MCLFLKEGHLLIRLLVSGGDCSPHGANPLGFAQLLLLLCPLARLFQRVVNSSAHHPSEMKGAQPKISTRNVQHGSMKVALEVCS